MSTAKIARKAGHWQTAYSAVLQAQESRGSFSRLQSSKLTKAIGEPLRALHELDHMLQGIEHGSQRETTAIIDLTDSSQKDELNKLANKVPSIWHKLSLSDCKAGTTPESSLDARIGALRFHYRPQGVQRSRQIFV